MFKIIKKGDTYIHDSNMLDLYQYRVYCGKQNIETHVKSSYWGIDEYMVFCKTGDGNNFTSNSMCVEIFGYTPETKTSTYTRRTELPYVNGCSTKQLIPPVRPGDPTFQLLYIPPHTSEQMHHIHATPRVVFVANGRGKSIIGTKTHNTEYELNVGDTIILDAMVPHHFETTDEQLIVLPVHIFSTVGKQEFNHPMYNGTHAV